MVPEVKKEDRTMKKSSMGLMMATAFVVMMVGQNTAAAASKYPLEKPIHSQR